MAAWLTVSVEAFVVASGSLIVPQLFSFSSCQHKAEMVTKKNIPLLGRRSMFGGLAKSKAPPPVPDLTIDQKCELILSEMERCRLSSQRHIESSVLHNVPQVFVTKDLYRELEEELNRLLMQQLHMEEEKRVHSSLPGGIISVYEDIEDTSLDANYCMACDASPCQWQPSCDEDSLTKQKKRLYHDLKELQKLEPCEIISLQSSVTRSEMNGDENLYSPNDVIKNLLNEIKEIDASIKLSSIDKELHDAFSTASESVIVKSIHGFPTTIQRESAIQALQYEHNRIIARELAAETLDKILHWMLEGWFFGLRDNCDGTEVSISHDDSRERGTMRSKAHVIQITSNADTMRAANAKNDSDDNLKHIENCMRYGLFCITFWYFRTLSRTKREKETWSGVYDAVTSAKKTRLSAERIKMIEEERNIAFRRARMEESMEKARRGEEKKRLRLERERLEKVSIIIMILGLKSYCKIKCLTILKCNIGSNLAVG